MSAVFPERLTQGYRSFLSGRFTAERSRYEQLAATGQKPSILVIGCVDSRVSPEVIFDAAPGELLVLRNVANLVPRYEPPVTPDEDISRQHGTSSALEFAVRALKVRHIVILGHEQCGGIKAFATNMSPLTSSDFIGRWMRQIAPAAQDVCVLPGEVDAYQRELEHASIGLGLKNLMTFPFVKAAVEAGDLSLHGAYFGVATGQMLVRDPGTGRFEQVGV